MAVTTTSVSVYDSSGTAQSMTTLTDPASLQRSAVSLDTPGVASYRAAATFTPQATGAVTLISIKGSATKTIRVKRILLGGHSTANAETTIGLQRTSALGSGGTTVTPTTAKMDSGTVAASTGVVSHYTTTLKAAGTATDGPLSIQEFTTGVITTPTVPTPMQSLFPETGSLSGSALVLRGTSDFIEVQNLNAGNLSTATVLTYMVEWEEDNS